VEDGTIVGTLPPTGFGPDLVPIPFENTRHTRSGRVIQPAVHPSARSAAVPTMPVPAAVTMPVPLARLPPLLVPVRSVLPALTAPHVAVSTVRDRVSRRPAPRPEAYRQDGVDVR
jgi:hypothetical protein